MNRYVKSISINISVLLMLFYLLFLASTIRSASTANFYYFNPDSAHSNFINLKQMMDKFLRTEGLTFSFQPFNRFLDFDRQVREKRPALLYLPEWYLKQDGNDKKYKPFLVPVSHGVTTYRKVLLVAADSALTKEKLANVTIAMTPVGPAGMTLLNEAIFKANGLDANRLKFITTTKDADALFALALGQVPAALISQNTMDRIGKLNPQILKNVKPLAVSAPLPMPMLCYAEGAIEVAEIKKIRNTLLMGKQDKNVAQLMEMLDVDAWHELNPL